MNKFLIALLALGAPALLPAEKNELGLTLGGLFPFTRDAVPASLRSGPGVALQANYARRLKAGERVAWFGEVHFMANGLRETTVANPRGVRDYATLFITPGLRVKFAPNARLSPYLFAGFGYTQYHSSELLQNRTPSPVRDRQHTYGGRFGGGADLRVWRFFSLRGEFADFVSPNPRYNIALRGGVQNNPVISGGFVINWGQ